MSPALSLPVSPLGLPWVAVRRAIGLLLRPPASSGGPGPVSPSPRPARVRLRWFGALQFKGARLPPSAVPGAASRGGSPTAGGDAAPCGPSRRSFPPPPPPSNRRDLLVGNWSFPAPPCPNLSGLLLSPQRPRTAPERRGRGPAAARQSPPRRGTGERAGADAARQFGLRLGARRGAVAGPGALPR